MVLVAVCAFSGREDCSEGLLDGVSHSCMDWERYKTENYNDAIVGHVFVHLYSADR